MTTDFTVTPRAQLRFTLEDLQQGFTSWHLWLALGWQDIRLRYRRSQLGPLWISLSTAVMIYSMGFLYANLFHLDLSSYYPYLAAGMITWAFISNMILESTEAFVESSGLIKQTCLPFSIYILRLLTRNFIAFLHNILPVLPILIYYKITLSLSCILALTLNVGLLLIIAFSYSMLFAMLGCRFRDMKPIISSLVQICFMLTPILWQRSMLPAKLQFINAFNPFYQLVELIRTPLLGGIPEFQTILYCCSLAVLGLFLMLIVLTKGRHRIAFWV